MAFGNINMSTVGELKQYLLRRSLYLDHGMADLLKPGEKEAIDKGVEESERKRLAYLKNKYEGEIK